MIAVDTNIVLRLVLDDDERQLQAIRGAMARNTLFVSLTVLLEAGWVLESRYAFTRVATADALQSLTSLERIVVARPDAVNWAIERYRCGADLADMLHIVSATKHESLLTLDRKIAKRAGEPPIPIETLA